MEKVGFIGLGRMGRGMASNLRRKGFELVVYDTNPEPMLALEKLGARRANGAAGPVTAKRTSRPSLTRYATRPASKSPGCPRAGSLRGEDLADQSCQERLISPATAEA